MTMSIWSVAEAKAHFSELVAETRRAPQPIAKRGRPVAVVVSAEEFDRLTQAASRPTFHPMRTFLALTEELKAGGDLALRLRKRRARRPRPSPFEA
jgi:prevent-host-death family protein